MNFSVADFRLMRWSLFSACASLLVSAAMLYSSAEYAQGAQKDQRDAQNLLSSARGHLATARQDQEGMAIYAGEYRALIERDIIGEEQRLDWMEGLENIRRKKLVTDFRYSIAPQKNFVAQPPIDSGNFNIGYSEMKLQFDLLHEEQLLDFFAALHSDIKGWYQVESCTMQRTLAAPGEEQNESESDGEGKGEVHAKPAAAAYLKAECSGGWITLKNRSAK